MAELGTVEELLGRASSYAGLRYSVDTASPELGALVQRVEERGTAIKNQLIFFELEWAALDDDHVASVLDDPALDFCRHFLEFGRVDTDRICSPSPKR